MINLRDKSLGTSFINLTYFKFACGDENPLKFVKLQKYYDHDFRWIKELMQTSGVDTIVFKPHSCRSASTSKGTCQGGGSVWNIETS